MSTGDTVRLAQALVRHLASLRVELDDGRVLPWCTGVWSIFGHARRCGPSERNCPPGAPTTSRRWPTRRSRSRRRACASASWR